MIQLRGEYLLPLFPAMRLQGLCLLPKAKILPLINKKKDSKLMTNEKILNGLVVFLSAYMKRWLEGHFYDKIFDSQLGKKLKTLDKTSKYGIEFGLYLLTAFFDEKLSEDNALKKFVKEVGIDAGPEISKRLINTKEQLSKNATSPEEKEIVSMLLQLEDQTLIDLLKWLYDIEPTEREEVLKQLSRLSIDEVAKLAHLKAEDIERIFDLINPPSTAKEKRTLLSPKAIQEIHGTTVKIEEMRKKLKQKRKAR